VPEPVTEVVEIEVSAICTKSITAIFLKKSKKSGQKILYYILFVFLSDPDYKCDHYKILRVSYFDWCLPSTAKQRTMM
jgi:hypothetical protein